MPSLDELNAAVTSAILKAENALDEAILAWMAVEKAEQAIADHPAADELEKAIGQRGAGSARVTYRVLNALSGANIADQVPIQTTEGGGT